jgi:flagellin
MQAQEYLRVTGDFQAKTINRVTSGLRIVSSGDDAAGLAIANSYRSDQAVISQGIRNANDGLATLQTIDGGINNIGKLLDRARTLATQSASDTFTGDRSVLDAEFQNVMSEINRQAQAIGMVSGGDFAKKLDVFIGGGRDGSTTAAVENGTISVDLSKSKLDTGSLGLTSSGVAGSVDVRAGSGAIQQADAANDAAVFTFKGAGFTSATVTLSTADLDGITDESGLVDKINQRIAETADSNSTFGAANISASLSSDGKIVFSGDKAFQVAGDTEGAMLVGAGTLTAGDVNKATVAWGGNVATAAQVVKVTTRDASGDPVAPISVNLATGTDQAAAVTALNAGLNNSGIFAVVNGTDIDLISDKGVAFELSWNANTAGLGAADVEASTFNASTVGMSIADADKAVTAVNSLAAAVKTLGTQQANVGKAQNQLNYAVSLASTQLTNLAASESRIRDADLAFEAANLTKAQVLQQAGIAALAQANSAPQAVLSLLRG